MQKKRILFYLETAIEHILTFQPKPGIHEVCKAIGHVGWELRRNTRTGDIEYQTIKEADWQHFGDRERINLEADIELSCKTRQSNNNITNFMPTKDKWFNGIEYLANLTQVDPFREWLDQIKVDADGDYSPLSECFRITGLDNHDSPEINSFRDWINLYPWIAAVAKAYYPHSKAHVCLVLIGAQGIGKSSFWQMSMPAEHRHEWVTDGIQLDGSRKEFAESCGNAVLGEIAELTGSGSRSKREHIKQVMTSSGMNIRFSYARSATLWQPKLVFVGTSNSKAPLPADPTGNRRFIALKVAKHELMKTNLQQVQYLADFWDYNREKIWANACVEVHKAHKAGYLNQLLSVPPDLEHIQRIFNKKATPETDARVRTRRYVFKHNDLPEIEIVDIWAASITASGFDQTGPIPSYVQQDIEQGLYDMRRVPIELADGRIVWMAEE